MAFSFGASFFSAFRGFSHSAAFEQLLEREDTELDDVLADDEVI
jgi:hypothetical protein